MPNCNPEYDLCKFYFINRVVNTYRILYYQVCSVS